MAHDAVSPGFQDAPVRLAADCMLGRLARRLRMLGFDTAYDRVIDDEDLITRCARDGRVLLTRDTRLAGRRLVRRLGTRVVLVRADDPDLQVAQVLRDLGLTVEPRQVLSRCLECNRILESLERAAAEGGVPPYVLATQRRFARCPACGRFYWRATHVDRMMRRLAAWLPGGEAEA
jgi:hypothetical protein